MSKIDGYILSTDYDRLAKLVRKQDVVCVVDYTANLTPRDVAKARFSFGKFVVGCRGTTFIEAGTEQEFAKQCEALRVEWLVPETEKSDSGSAENKEWLARIAKTLRDGVVGQCDHVALAMISVTLKNVYNLGASWRPQHQPSPDTSRMKKEIVVAAERERSLRIRLDGINEQVKELVAAARQAKEDPFTKRMKHGAVLQKWSALTGNWVVFATEPDAVNWNEFHAAIPYGIRVALPGSPHCCSHCHSAPPEKSQEFNCPPVCGVCHRCHTPPCDPLPQPAPAVAPEDALCGPRKCGEPVKQSDADEAVRLRYQVAVLDGVTARQVDNDWGQVFVGDNHHSYWIGKGGEFIRSEGVLEYCLAHCGCYDLVPDYPKNTSAVSAVVAKQSPGVREKYALALFKEVFGFQPAHQYEFSPHMMAEFAEAPAAKRCRALVEVALVAAVEGSK